MKLPKCILREIIRVFRMYAETDDEKRAFRPYAHDGGMDGTHDHRTTKGLRATIDETLNGAPVELWIEPDTQPANRFLRHLSLRQNWQTITVAERLRKEYIKPLLMHGNEDFETLWLSSDQIIDVVRRATKRHRSFRLVGVFGPEEDVAMAVLDAWDQKVKTYAIVWNTSSHGVHWVTTLFFPKTRRWEYFDSRGHRPSTQLRDKIEDVLRAIDMTSEEDHQDEWDLTPIANVQHQHKPYQCGVYAIWYIVQRVVEGRSYRDIQSHEVPDQVMIELRHKYFREAPIEVRQMFTHEIDG